MKQGLMICVVCVLCSHNTHAQQVRLHYRYDTALVMRAWPPAPATHRLPGTIPSDTYTRSFGFFCRQELKMHQAHIPLSFRLGSMEYCDMMEQKGNGGRK